MTLVAICLALMRLAPLPGFLLMVVCVPAAIRTAVSVRYHAWRGERLTMIGKVGAFVSSFLIVLWMVLLAGFTGIAIATLFAVPLALFFEPQLALGLAFFPGAAATIAALASLLWMFRPGSLE